MFKYQNNRFRPERRQTGLVCYGDAITDSALTACAIRHRLGYKPI